MRVRACGRVGTVRGGVSWKGAVRWLARAGPGKEREAGGGFLCVVPDGRLAPAEARWGGPTDGRRCWWKYRLSQVLQITRLEGDVKDVTKFGYI